MTREGLIDACRSLLLIDEALPLVAQSVDPAWQPLMEARNSAYRHLARALGVRNVDASSLLGKIFISRGGEPRVIYQDGHLTDLADELIEKETTE